MVAKYSERALFEYVYRGRGWGQREEEKEKMKQVRKKKHIIITATAGRRREKQPENLNKKLQSSLRTMENINKTKQQCTANVNTWKQISLIQVKTKVNLTTHTTVFGNNASKKKKDA